MIAAESGLDTAGRLLIVACFLVTGVSNLTRARIKDHVDRMVAFGTPLPTAAFWFGIALQLIGCALLLTGWHAELGAWCLIVFTVAATAIFHRFWRMEDPMRRNFSRLMLLSNAGVLGGLLLLLANVR
ncbi:MAG TPA: DoxX family protein [Burkholderiales bacterium]|nr:DoxX family protein [Burkholderiales bacterium]